MAAPAAQVHPPAVSLRTGPRIAVIDGLRGLAILLVILHHFTPIAVYGRIDRLVRFWTYGGWLGVDLFFVLSGFLITGILIDAKGTTNYFRNFYCRRALRIFPIYYILLVLSIVVIPWFNAAQAQNLKQLEGDHIWYWLYLTNWSIAFSGDWRNASLGHLDIAWSLAIEEQFYLVWPFVVLWIERRRLWVVCVGLVVLAAAARGALLLAGAPPVANYALTLTRMDGLAAGSLVALVMRDHIGWELLHRWARRLAGIFAVTVVLLAVHLGGFRESNRVMQLVGYTLVVLSFGSLLVVALGASRRSWLAGVLEQPWVRALGRYSYALYLSHLPVKMALEPWFYRPEPIFVVGSSALPTQIAFTLSGLVLSLLVAWVSWHVIEKRFLGLKRFFAAAPDDSRAGSEPNVAPGRPEGLAMRVSAGPAA